MELGKVSQYSDWAKHCTIRIQFPAGTITWFFDLPPRQTGSGTHPASYPESTGDLSLTAKQMRQSDHSLLCSSKDKNVWSCTSTPPYTMWCLIKHRNRKLQLSHLIIFRTVFSFPLAWWQLAHHTKNILIRTNKRYSKQTEYLYFNAW